LTTPDGRSRIVLRLFTVVASAALAASAHAADDPAAGRKKAASTCQVCHGLDGIAKLPDAPNLAGQNKIYLGRSLKAYKTGERKNPQMSVVATTLSDDDISNLAAYYSSIKVAVEKP